MAPQSQPKSNPGLLYSLGKSHSTDKKIMNTINPNEALRKYPRKEFQRKIGILFGGLYQVVDGVEISEGGLSFQTDMVFAPNRECVLTFKIPKGDFISLRGTIKHMTKNQGFMNVGVSFIQVPFSNKRQIRNFIADRSA